jgi:nitroimidazol reductase NimA-like FMN-containing flavoprotein (pyridoxamine 5'-phosphate oxidase superfamily)
MNTQIQIKDYVSQVLYSSRFAVLATESEGQPYASFIAITPLDDLSQLIFATYRNTRKYSNLKRNDKVSILFEYRSDKNLTQQQATILTAFGKAKEVEPEESITLFNSHLIRHPQLKDFLLSEDFALFLVKVEAYQSVMGIEDIKWWYID